METIVLDSFDQIPDDALLGSHILTYASHQLSPARNFFVERLRENDIDHLISAVEKSNRLNMLVDILTLPWAPLTLSVVPYDAAFDEQGERQESTAAWIELWLLRHKKTITNGTIILAFERGGEQTKALNEVLEFIEEQMRRGELPRPKNLYISK